MDKQWFYARAAGSPDMNNDLARRFERAHFRLTMVLIMTLTFMIYGGLHLLAWQYNLDSRPALYRWRASAVRTSSTGIVLLTDTSLA